MNLTAYHAKLFAHELTKRSSSDNVDKLASAFPTRKLTSIPTKSRQHSLRFVRRYRRALSLRTKLDLAKPSKPASCLRSDGRSEAENCSSSARPICGSSGARNSATSFSCRRLSLKPRRSTRPSAAATSIRSTNQRSSSAPTSLHAPRSPTCGKRLGIWSSSTKRIVLGMFTSRRTRSL
jgi:hypothetical protein